MGERGQLWKGENVEKVEKWNRIKRSKAEGKGASRGWHGRSKCMPWKLPVIGLADHRNSFKSARITHTGSDTGHGDFQRALKIGADGFAAAITLQQLRLQVIERINVGLTYL
jgi:hypothetical protein